MCEVCHLESGVLGTRVGLRIRTFRKVAHAETKKIRTQTTIHTSAPLVLLLVTGLAMSIGFLAASNLAFQHSQFAWLAATSSVMTIGIIFTLGAIVMLCMPRVYRRDRPEEVERVAAWRRFRAWMQHMTTLEHEQVPSLDLWERNVVYAVAFGCAPAVLRVMHYEDRKGRSLTGKSPLHWITADTFGSFARIGTITAAGYAAAAPSAEDVLRQERERTFLETYYPLLCIVTGIAFLAVAPIVSWILLTAGVCVVQKRGWDKRKAQERRPGQKNAKRWR